MSVVKINAIEIPEGAGPELEKRFAARLGAVEGSPGFEEFCLLRPTGGETRYFVYTRWESEAAFQDWSATRSQAAPRRTAVRGVRSSGGHRGGPARIRSGVPHHGLNRVNHVAQTVSTILPGEPFSNDANASAASTNG